MLFIDENVPNDVVVVSHRMFSQKRMFLPNPSSLLAIFLHVDISVGRFTYHLGGSYHSFKQIVILQEPFWSSNKMLYYVLLKIKRLYLCESYF